MAQSSNIRPEVSTAVARRLEAYHWPGNIRELQHVMERAAILAGGRPLREEMLSIQLDEEKLGARAPAASRPAVDPGHEVSVIRAALERHGGNIQRTARSLGISRQALYRRLDKHGLRRR